MTGKRETEREGILCAGNWIIDHVKMITFWPSEDTLTNIVSEETGTGGSPYNVLVDLARFGLGIPLFGLGLVGDDADGRRILEDCDRWGVDRSLLSTSSEAVTAYTDVMTVVGSGRRTFFHHRGTNALLSEEHFPVDAITARVASLGYLLLLDALDAEDPDHGTAAARVLSSMREAGILTAIDVVSEDSDRFRTVVSPSLPHADYCIINEIEAGRITGLELRAGDDFNVERAREAASELLSAGVQRQVVIHAPEGALGAVRDGEILWQPAHVVPEADIRGTAGAGDAFFAACLAGIHEGWPLERSLRFANAAAVTCLSHPTTTGGVGSVEEIEEIARTLPLRERERD